MRSSLYLTLLGQGPVSDPSITLHLGGVVVYFVGAGLERSYCVAGILEIALRALFAFQYLVDALREAYTAHKPQRSSPLPLRRQKRLR